MQCMYKVLNAYEKAKAVFITSYWGFTDDSTRGGESIFVDISNMATADIRSKSHHQIPQVHDKGKREE